MTGEFLISYRTLKKYNGNSAEVHIPENVEKIAENAFQGNKSVRRIFLPRGLRLIEDCAFADCSNLRELVLPRFDLLFGPKIKPLAFYWSGINRIILSKDVMAIQPEIREMFTKYTGKNIVNVFVAEDNNKFVDIDGVVYSKDKTRIFLYPRGRKEECYEIPVGVKCIEKETFANSQLRKIIIPEGVDTIKEGAFAGCRNIKSIYLPTSLKKVYPSIFAGCKSLKNVSVSRRLKRNNNFIFSLPCDPEFRDLETDEI